MSWTGFPGGWLADKNGLRARLRDPVAPVMFHSCSTVASVPVMRYGLGFLTFSTELLVWASTPA